MFPEARPQPPFVLRRATPRGEAEWTIGWALLPPQAGSAPKSAP
jgi:hypothetical protein